MSRHDYVLQTEPMQPLVSPPAPPVPIQVRLSGLLCAAYVAGVHLGVCDETYKEARYLGAAFVAGAFVLSRTVGLPSYHHVDWPAIQVIALVAEAGYLALTAVALRLLRPREDAT